MDLQAALCCWRPCQQDSDDLPSFPPHENLWEGGRFVCLGSGIYYKKILFISVQVPYTHLPSALCSLVSSGIWVKRLQVME